MRRAALAGALALAALATPVRPQEEGRQSGPEQELPAPAPTPPSPDAEGLPRPGPSPPSAPPVQKTPAPGPDGESARDDAPTTDVALPGAADPSSNAAPTSLPAFDATRAWTAEDMDAHLRQLAARYPSLVRVEGLGLSRAGRPIPLAAIGGREPGSPAILVGDWLAGERTSGGVAALALADRLVRRAAEDPALAEKLERTAVYVAPALDPDRRAEHLSGKAGTAGARFDRNFPTGWQPEGIRPGSGPYPLSLLESRALYGFLSGHREVAVALALGAPSSGDVRASAATAETLDALVSAWSSVGSDAVALLTPLAPGSWVEHCRTALGVHALVLDAGDGPPPDLLPGVLAVIDCLPELRFGAPTARALSPGLWQVDVELSNSGLLPTRSLPSPDGRGARVALEGGRLVAVAGGRPEATLAVLEAAADGSVPLADLGGGERYLLRLVVEAPAGTELSLSGDAAHARPTRTALRL